MSRKLKTIWPRALIAALFIPAATAGTSVSTPAVPPGEEAGRAAPAPRGLDGVRVLIEKAEYAQAASLARHVLADIEKRHGGESLQAAEVLDLLVEALRRGGEADTAGVRETAERAVRIKERVMGLDHPDVARSVSNLAAVLKEAADYAAARRLYERAIAIQEKAFGDGDARVARSLAELANVLTDTGEYAGAKPLYERALAIQERTLAHNHPELARTAHNFAIMFHNSGNYHKAKALYERALAIRETVHGPEHLEVASSLNSLAVLHKDLGNFAQAKSYYRRSLAIREQALGPDHIRVAWSLNNLANLLARMGDYTEARSLFERALEIETSRLGPDHPDVAMTQGNLGRLLSLTGDYTGARPLYERALAIRQKTLGPDHPEVATALHDMASLLSRVGEHGQARTLFERALEIWERKLGTDHADYAGTMSGLAGVLVAIGETDRAERLFSRALTILEGALGGDHPAVAHNLGNLADLLVRRGDFSAARLQYERALDIRKRSLGSDHPLVADALGRLAVVLALTGAPYEALDAALRTEELGRSHLLQTARALPERQALRYASLRPSGLDLSLSLNLIDADRTSRQRVSDAVIRSRALIIDEMASRRRTVRRAAQITQLSAELTAVQERLANLTVRGPGYEPSDRYRLLLDETEKKKEHLERALAKNQLAFDEEPGRRSSGMAEVAAALPPESALASFVLYSRYELPTGEENRLPDDISRGSSIATGARRGRTVRSYLAFVLRAGGRHPHFVRLGTAEEIETMVSRWNREAARGALLPGRTPDEAVIAYRAAGETLRRTIWDPLEPLLRGRKIVFLIPDGALHLVSWGALPSGKTSFLVETGPPIHYLSAERDILLPVPQTRGSEGLLVLGGPAFDDRSALASLAAARGDQAGTALLQRPDLTAYRGHRPSCGDFRSFRFEPLPAAAREADQIVSLWERALGQKRAALLRRHDATAGDTSDVVHLTGAAASETAFKQSAPGRRVLHLATHGFFLGGDCPSQLDLTRGVGGLIEAHPDRSLSPDGENPLLLSGLALAGANHRESARPDEQDGILTAEEIAAMDLGGVEWAVLSACDTGVGEVKAGEGVFGLRRAFQVAGVRTVLMSLWAVEDEAAREWMTQLYEARVLEALPTAAAIREASLRILLRRQQAHQSTHPFYWGGFVAAGDWR